MLCGSILRLLRPKTCSRRMPSLCSTRQIGPSRNLVSSPTWTPIVVLPSQLREGRGMRTLKVQLVNYAEYNNNSSTWSLVLYAGNWGWFSRYTLSGGLSVSKKPFLPALQCRFRKKLIFLPSYPVCMYHLIGNLWFWCFCQLSDFFISHHRQLFVIFVFVAATKFIFLFVVYKFSAGWRKKIISPVSLSYVSNESQLYFSDIQ